MTGFDTFVVSSVVSAMIENIADGKKRLELLDAMIQYGAKGLEPVFSDNLLATIWICVKDSIDTSKSRRVKKQQTEEAEEASPTRLRGRPRKESVAESSEQSESTAQALAHHAAESPEYTKPSIDDVLTFCKQEHLNVDGFQFVNFYQSNGWKTKTGAPIRDWKSVCKYWASTAHHAEKRLNQGFKNVYEMQKTEYDKERAPMLKMQATYPKDWAICMNARRKEHDGEFYGLSEAAVFEEMKKAGFKI